MLRTIFFIILFLILFIVYMHYLEQRSIFFPMKQIEITPRAVDLNYQEISFKNKDGLWLNSWFIPLPETKKTILFFHGNAGNISHRLEKITFWHNLGFNVFIFDYRGYGKSEGKPNEEGFYQDARAAYDYLLNQKKLSEKEIVLFGESLGAGVAIDLATKVNPSAIIVESTFSSVVDMAKLIYPFLPSFIIKSRFDSFSKVKEIKIPKLFIHSLNDEIVPFKLGQKLFISASQPKDFLEIRGRHNSAFTESEGIIENKIKDFLGK